ncbi:hypothetical protein Stube_04270 [Streptomyces tubercidicus]|uniref:Uncharacterized protein n=1 Tax=Streptomyces tubercidicus TaxID=47759 RepID=A0A640UKA3_9ACTN|nr:hypothetical protein Stube_04270 [Streptomyces tubercidicus]
MAEPNHIDMDRDIEKGIQIGWTAEILMDTSHPTSLTWLCVSPEKIFPSAPLPRTADTSQQRGLSLTGRYYSY